MSGIAAGQEDHLRAEQDFRTAAGLSRGNAQILLMLDAEISRGRAGDWDNAVEALLPLEREHGITRDGPLAKPVRRATISCERIPTDAKDRIAALSKAGLRSRQVDLIGQKIETEQSRFPPHNGTFRMGLRRASQPAPDQRTTESQLVSP